MIAEGPLLEALEGVHSGRLRVQEAYRQIRAAEINSGEGHLEIWLGDLEELQNDLATPGYSFGAAARLRLIIDQAQERLEAAS